MTLVHGDADYTVPSSSTSKFSHLASQVGAQVNELHIPECGHLEICLDLMDPNRKFYDMLMGLVNQIAQIYLEK